MKNKLWLLGIAGLAALAAAPAQAATVTVSGDTVSYVGLNTNENVVIFDNAGANQMFILQDTNNNGVQDGGELTTFATNIRVIDIQTNGGADNVTYRLLSSLLGGSRSIQVNFGAGEAQSAGSMPVSNFTFNTGASTLDSAGGVGSNVDIEVSGGGNPENVDLLFNTISESSVNLSTDLGLGDDSADLVLGGAVDLSFIDADLNLGGARIKNTASFFQTATLTTGSSVDVDITGGAQVDQVAAGIQAQNFASRLNYDVNLGAGNDTSNLSFPEGFAGVLFANFPEVKVTMNGEDGNDVLSVTPLQAATASPVTGTFEITLNGGAGNDTLKADLGASDALANNGFLFLLRVRLLGGAGNDGLTFVSSTTGNTNNFFYDVALYGGAGTDALSSMLTSTVPFQGFFGPSSSVILDGGSGISDTASHFFTAGNYPFDPFARVSIEF